MPEQKVIQNPNLYVDNRVSSLDNLNSYVINKEFDHIAMSG